MGMSGTTGPSQPTKAGCQEHREEMRRLFKSQLPLPKQGEPRLVEAVRYVLEHPGSLVRAALCYRVSRIYRLEESVAAGLAIAVEYYHTASLVFDDLPCMDNAAIRRNADCCHVKHGEATAILAALSLINRAYALAWEAMNDLPEARRRFATKFLEECLGLAGLANGQSRDLAYGKSHPSASRVLKVAMGKTVPLIRLTLVWPALVADAPPGEIRLWKLLAVYWGLAYQILDDIKDLHSGAVDTGKTGNRDFVLQRSNLAVAEGARASFHRAARLLRLGDEAIFLLPGRASRWEFLHGLRRKLAGELDLCRQATGQPVHGELSTP